MSSIGRYTIKIAGKEIDNWSSFSVGQTLDLNNESGTITFPDFEPLKNITFVNQDIEILRDGVLCWRGLGLDYENVLNSQGYRDWNLTMQSNKIYLAKEAFRKGGSLVYAYGGTITSYNALPPQSTLIKDIFNDILACQYTPILTLGKLDTPTNYPHVTVLFARTFAMYALLQLINASLWEVRFNPDNTVDLQQTVGSQTPVFSFVEGMNLLDFRFKYGIGKSVNDPIVCGAGSATGTRNAVNDNQLFAEPTNNASSLSAYSRWSKIYSFSSIYDVNTLTAYANALQSDLKQPLYTLNLLVTLPAAGMPFKIGDVVSVTSPTLGLTAEAYRIVGMNLKYDATTGEQITLTVQPNARLVSLAHMRMRSLEYILNSQTMNQQATNNTINANPATVPLSVVGACAFVANQGGGYAPGPTYNPVLLTTDAHLKIPNTGTGNNYSFEITASVSGSGIYQLNEIMIIDNTTGTTLYDSGPQDLGGSASYSLSLNSTNLNGHDIIFRVIGLGEYSSAFGVANWNQTVSGYFNTTSNTSMTEHVGLGLTGTFAGGSATIEIETSNVTLASPQVSIIDATTLATLYNNTNPSPNTQYNATLSSDVMDHDIEFQMSDTTTTVSAYPASLIMVGTLTLSQPTLPT